MTATQPGDARINVGNVPFDVTTLDDAASLIVSLASRQKAIPIRLSNAYCVAVADKDPEYRELLQGVGLNFPDGTPVAWVMKRLASTDQHPQRVRGPSLFNLTLEKGREHGLKHFLLGTSPQTLELLVESIARQYPGTIIAGKLAPPFGPLNSTFYDSCSAAIQTANPHVVWIALGSPKQDFAAAKLTELTNTTCVGVGAAFDFLAGTAAEAPRWTQKIGMEWAYRLVTEPKRLWRRYLIGNVQFLSSVLRQTKLSEFFASTK